MSFGSESEYIQANVNGSLCDPRTPAISPLDRGFLYGDAVYEVWRSYENKLFAWDEHWERLMATAEGIGLDLPIDSAGARLEVERTIAEWRRLTDCSSEVYVRLQISRGSGEIGLDPRLAADAVYVIYVKALLDLSDEILNRGMRLHVAKKLIRTPIEALSPALKTGNYLNNILGLKEAREAGADDALFRNGNSDFCETSTRNIWFVFEDRIVTPPLSDGLLAGVTRRVIFESFSEFEGLSLREESVGEEQLAEVREVFLSSSTQDVQPVASIDEVSYELGEKTISRRLKAALRTRIADALCSTPQG